MCDKTKIDTDPIKKGLKKSVVTITDVDVADEDRW